MWYSIVADLASCGAANTAVYSIDNAVAATKALQLLRQASLFTEF